MNTSSKPRIEGRLVTLRPFTIEDVDEMYEATREPVTRQLTGTHREFTREQIERWCEHIAAAEGRIDLVIESAESGHFLGEVVLNDIDLDNRSASFRIALAGPQHFGKGYGSEAARLMLDHAFDDLQLNRVWLEVFDFNERAIRTYERLGFKREGLLREALHQDGRYHDAIVMGLLRREYRPQ